MTCILGLEYNNKVYMGCDSMAASNKDMYVTSLKKVFVRDEMIFGYTSSFRFGQLLQYSLDIPTDNYYKDGSDPFYYLVNSFIPALRDCLATNGYTRIDNNVEEGGTMLLGYKGKLYSIYDDFQVNRSEYGFNSVGCGSSYALGAMDNYLFEGNGATWLQIDQIIESCLTTAAKFSNGVCAPFYVRSV